MRHVLYHLEKRRRGRKKASFFMVVQYSYTMLDGDIAGQGLVSCVVCIVVTLHEKVSKS